MPVSYPHLGVVSCLFSGLVSWVVSSLLRYRCGMPLGHGNMMKRKEKKEAEEEEEEEDEQEKGVE